jgi:hypothetical protein
MPLINFKDLIKHKIERSLNWKIKFNNLKKIYINGKMLNIDIKWISNLKLDKYFNYNVSIEG